MKNHYLYNNVRQSRVDILGLYFVGALTFDWIGFSQYCSISRILWLIYGSICWSIRVIYIMSIYETIQKRLEIAASAEGVAVSRLHRQQSNVDWTTAFHSTFVHSTRMTRASNCLTPYFPSHSDPSILGLLHCPMMPNISLSEEHHLIFRQVCFILWDSRSNSTISYVVFLFAFSTGQFCCKVICTWILFCSPRTDTAWSVGYFSS